MKLLKVRKTWKNIFFFYKDESTLMSKFSIYACFIKYNNANFTKIMNYIIICNRFQDFLNDSITIKSIFY